MSPNELDKSCFEDRWEAFQFSGKDAMLSNDADSQSQWDCVHDDHHVSHTDCVDDACCEEDNCSLNCSSVCDGFIDCDVSTVCSESHCDDLNCGSTGPICFDRNCFGDDHGIDQGLEFLGPDAQISWDAGFLPSAPTREAETPQSYTTEEHIPNDGINIDATQEPFPNLSTNVNHVGHPMSHHHGCLGFPKQPDMDIWSPTYSGQGDITGVEMYDPLDSSVEKPSPFPTFIPPDCSNTGYQHLFYNSKYSADANLHPFAKQRNSNSHGHIHCQWHQLTYPHYTNHSRSSINSRLLSSPVETPPPLDNSASPILTSPTYTAEDDGSSICKWIMNTDGIKPVCGASLPDSSALQQHLASVHVGPVDGPRGSGYYCRWEGCHRPDEPFSQKSKLQGHFLIHSNYKSFKCPVCEKLFARQATLDRHERSHRGEKPYKCSECGKAFTDSSELKTHSRTHTGEKPFKCAFPGCNFQTGDSSNMSSHKLSISSPNPVLLPNLAK
ncbi:hypothetical protein V8E54_014296 [Elaphomyces granulatus]